MDFYAYWKRLTVATPGLLDLTATMRLTVAAFRAAVQKAYETGRCDEAESIKDSYQAAELPDAIRELFGDLK